MDEQTRKMLGYVEGEKIPFGPSPILDLAHAIVMANKFLIYYHNHYGMLPSQNAAIYRNIC